MKRVLASIGIGGATVNTVFPRAEFSPGETVTATVELHGGEATQTIEGVYFQLKARLPGGNGEQTVGEFTVDESVTLEPGEELAIPVDVHFPLWVPVTLGGVSVWLETGLAIDWAKDPSDEDEIEIVPGEFAAVLFEVMGDLGFALRDSKLVEMPILDDRPFAQKFDFRPADGQFADEVDDVEVTLIPREDDLRAFFEVDRVDEVAEEYDLDFDEQEVSITFDRADANMMRRRLKNAIEART